MEPQALGLQDYRRLLRLQCAAEGTGVERGLDRVLAGLQFLGYSHGVTARAASSEARFAAFDDLAVSILDRDCRFRA